MEYLETAELIKVLTEAKKRGAREHFMFLAAYHHGLRASEISLLTLADVRNGSIDIRRLKGSKHTIQPLKSHANPLLDEHKALAAWLRERGDADGSKMLFTSRNGSGISRRQIYNLFEDCAFKAGIEAGRRNPHILKHSICSHMVRAGVEVAYIQQAMGHSDPKSTISYLHITQSEAAAKVDGALGKIFA